MTRRMSITPWSQKAGPGKLAGFGFTLSWNDPTPIQKSAEDAKAQHADEGTGHQRTQAPRPVKGV